MILGRHSIKRWISFSFNYYNNKKCSSVPAPLIFRKIFNCNNPYITFFLENAITEDKMSLKTFALAHFIQNKLYLQYIFIILL